jgi:protein SCO1/2
VIRALHAAMLCFLSALLAGACGGGGSSPGATVRASSALRGVRVDPPTRATDFALADQAGQIVRLSKQRGKYVILTFLYTHCPDVCPLIASNLNQALRQLGRQRSNVRVIAVSVDPRRDTPTAVVGFVTAHHLLPQFHYLTGSRADLAPIWRAYHVTVTREGKSIGHSAYEMLIDPNGRGRLIYDAQVPAADVIHDIRVLESRQASR